MDLLILWFTCVPHVCMQAFVGQKPMAAKPVVGRAGRLTSVQVSARSTKKAPAGPQQQINVSGVRVQRTMPTELAATAQTRY